MPQDHIEIYLALRAQQGATEALFWLLVFAAGLFFYLGLAAWLMERYERFIEIENKLPAYWHRSLSKGIGEWWAECVRRWNDEQAIEYDRLEFVYWWRHHEALREHPRVWVPTLVALSYPVARVRLVAWSAKFAVCCSPIGHDLESNDWAGPESGGMGVYCKRCGWSFHHTLY